ncbi:MAG: hypothetical protein AABZ55_12280, partial [Bdellovibrionota bacterium]
MKNINLIVLGATFLVTANAARADHYPDPNYPNPGYPGQWGCVQKNYGGKICVNDSIMDRDGDVGVVLQVFQNGQAQVRYDSLGGRIYTLNVDNLYREIGCSGQICAGQTVIDTDRDIGYVLQVFENQRARVRYDRLGGRVYTIDVSRLSP